jgi:uncharacterized membrane protein YdfJ with MMPL/SSD domain
MFERFGEFVSRYWLAIILVWVIGLVVIHQTTPTWNSVTHDGDLAYLPPDLSSIAGERLLEAAFPTGRSKSEMVVVVAREDHPLTADDISIVDRIEELARHQSVHCIPDGCNDTKVASF